MALFKKTALGSAILAAIAVNSSYAATGSYDSIMDGMFNDSFFSDSKLTLQLKNYYRNNKANRPDAGPTDRDSAWTQAAHLDFQSGWFMNWVGLDLSSYYSLKLAGSKGKSDVGLLQVDNNGKSNSYGKVGYALKVNLMDHGMVKYGRMVVDTPLFKSSTEYALPTLYEGFYGDYSWEGLKGYAGYFTKASDVTKSGFDSFSADSSSGTDVDVKKRGIMVYGLEYAIDDLALRATQVSQRDFATFTYGDAAYMMPTSDMGSFTFGAQYGHTGADGAQKDIMKGNDEKTSLSFWGARLRWDMDKLSAGLSHVSIGSKGGPTTNTNGWDTARMELAINNSAAEVGNRFVGYTAGLINDFAAPGTSSTRVDLGYDLSDFVGGLSASAGYIFGQVNYGSGNEDHDVSEFDIGVNYKIPFVKGLSAELQHGRFMDKYKASGDNKKDRESDTRIILNYEIAVF